MSIVRRFLIAPSLSRLIRKERGAARVAEGYFAAQSGRNSYVLVDGTACHLVLQTPSPEGGPAAEERTEVPRAHAEALLDVCAGKIAYDRSRVGVGGGREALVDRFSIPGPFDLVSVEFETAEDAQRFYAPAWFGQEVTGQEGYERRAIALAGLPQGSEAPLTNAALDALLDVLEDRFGLSRYGSAPAARREEEPRVMDALRRLAGTGPAAPAPAAQPHAPAPAAPAPTAQAPTAQAPTAQAAEPRPAPARRSTASAPVASRPAAAQPVPSQGPAARAAAQAAAQASAPEPAAEAPASQPEGEVDSRIDDVILGLSRALGAPSDDEQEGSVVEVEQWGQRRSRGER